jgi:hypothetical protein
MRKISKLPGKWKGCDPSIARGRYQTCLENGEDMIPVLHKEDIKPAWKMERM